MTDDQAQRGTSDSDRINTGQEQELAYWTAKWGVSRQQIIDCVKKVGGSVESVRKCLGK